MRTRGTLAWTDSIRVNIHVPKIGAIQLAKAAGPQLLQAVEWCIASGRCHEPFGRDLSTSMQCKQTGLPPKASSLQMYWGVSFDARFWERQRKMAELCSCIIPFFCEQQARAVDPHCNVSPNTGFILSVSRSRLFPMFNSSLNEVDQIHL